MSGSTGVEERGQYDGVGTQRSNKGWLWTLTGLLVGTVIALIFAFRISSYAVNKSRQAEQQAQAAAASAQQAKGLAQQATARADSAKTAVVELNRKLIAANAEMHELASWQYAIKVRADRLDSAVTSIAAGLEELEGSVQQDFNFVADRIDSTLAVADGARKLAGEAIASDANLRGGLDAVRTSLQKDISKLYRRTNIILPFIVAKEITDSWRDADFKRK